MEGQHSRRSEPFLSPALCVPGEAQNIERRVEEPLRHPIALLPNGFAKRHVASLATTLVRDDRHQQGGVERLLRHAVRRDFAELVFEPGQVSDGEEQKVRRHEAVDVALKLWSRNRAFSSKSSNHAGAQQTSSPRASGAEWRLAE